ncbi:MAG TPA: MBL fold metallo-hydrolase [Nitrososphaerales archaeon]|nr:MBL fold metallo-hydrolase [Nitrososphaerales archaeon]
MVGLKFFGGINEIGGNKILVEDRKNDARVFLDFGMNFRIHSMYFEEFIQPRTSNGITDFLETGLLPNIDGIYRKDLLKFAGKQTHDTPLVDAVILSHAHLDHAAHISFLDEDIPIYCNAITRAVLEAIQETSPRRMESEILDYKRRPLLNQKDRPVERSFKIVDGKFKVGGLEMEMLPVDHSVPGASALIIYGFDKTIAYSGDLRLHGTDGMLTMQFVDKLKSVRPDIFLCEGTRIDETERNTEAYVKTNSEKVISQTKGLVVADFAFKDITRFKTFFEIAKSTQRKLAIPFRDAYYIRKLSTLIRGLPSLKDDQILLYQDKRNTGTYRDSDYGAKWENEFLHQPNTVRADHIAKYQDEVMVAIGYYDIVELIDMMPRPGSAYIKSASEVINEEQEFDLDRLKAWLDHFGMRYHHFHASGHAPRDDLALVMNDSNARKLVPIHTEHPEMYEMIARGKSVEMPSLAT